MDTQKGWQTETLATFTQKWSGIALLIEPDERSGETDYISKRRAEIRQNLRTPFLVVGIVASFLLWFVSVPGIFPTPLWSLNALWAVKVVGTLVCSILLWHSIDADNPFIRTFCSLDSRNHCNSILHSKAARLWGWLGWSEIGFVYYAGGLTALLLSLSNPQANVFPWLLIGSLLALPYTLFSVYYQAVVARQWCLLCLSVQILLGLEVALSLSLWHSTSFALSLSTLTVLILSYLLPIIIWVLLKKPLQESYQVNPLLRELHKTKFNPNYVNELFNKQPTMPPILEGMKTIKMGHPGAQHTLTVVTNPLCAPCGRLHTQLEELMRVTNNIQCQFIFFGTSHALQVAEKLLELPQDKALKALHNWYNNNSQSIQTWIASIPITTKQENLDVKWQVDYHARWCQLAQIRATPTVYFNGVSLPVSYTIKDLPILASILSDRGIGMEY